MAGSPTQRTTRGGIALDKVSFVATVPVEVPLPRLLDECGIDPAEYAALSPEMQWAVLQQREVAQAAFGLAYGQDFRFGERVAREADELDCEADEPKPLAAQRKANSADYWETRIRLLRQARAWMNGEYQLPPVMDPEVAACIDGLAGQVNRRHA